MMRYIDLENLLTQKDSWNLSGDWWKNAALKDAFRKYGYDKCWYTECSIAGSDVDIDHFRPKARIAEYEGIHFDYNTDIADTGYSWLKNDLYNYRACCIYANRRRKDNPDDTVSYGKGCYFPLKKGSPKLLPNKSISEDYMLLDPCCKSDVALLSFLDGKPIAARSDSHTNDRVKVSIDLYHMNAPAIKAERIAKWKSVFATLDEFRNGDISEKSCIRQLKDYISRKSTYSACAIACIKFYDKIYGIPDSILSQLNMDL